MMGQMRLLDDDPPLLGRERDAELILSQRVEACNAEAAVLLGYAPSELTGIALERLFPAAQPDGTPSGRGFEIRRGAARPDLPQCFVWQFQRADGAVADLLVQLEVEPQLARSARLRLRDLSSLRRADRALE